MVSIMPALVWYSFWQWSAHVPGLVASRCTAVVLDGDEVVIVARSGVYGAPSRVLVRGGVCAVYVQAISAVADVSTGAVGSTPR